MNKQNIISWIALALSIIACIITWARIDVYITNDTFVGIMTSFMGICATIVVGTQIYNSIETSKKIKEIEELQKQVAKDIEYLKKERERGDHFTMYGVNFSLGISKTSSNSLFFAYNSYFDALVEAMILDNPKYINNTLSNLEFVCRKISEEKTIQLSKSFKEEKYTPDNLKKYTSYYLIKDRYKRCYEITLNAYRQCQKKSETAS